MGKPKKFHPSAPRVAGTAPRGNAVAKKSAGKGFSGIPDTTFRQLEEYGVSRAYAEGLFTNLKFFSPEIIPSLSNPESPEFKLAKDYLEREIDKNLVAQYPDKFTLDDLDTSPKALELDTSSKSRGPRARTAKQQSVVPIRTILLTAFVLWAAKVSGESIDNAALPSYTGGGLGGASGSSAPQTSRAVSSRAAVDTTISYTPPAVPSAHAALRKAQIGAASALPTPTAAPTPTVTRTTSPSPSGTGSVTTTVSFTPSTSTTPSVTETTSVTTSATGTVTETTSSTVTVTPSTSTSPSVTKSESFSATATGTATYSSSTTVSTSASSSVTNSVTKTYSVKPTPSVTPSASPSASLSALPSATPTQSVSATMSVSPSGVSGTSVTSTPTSSVVRTASITPSITTTSEKTFSHSPSASPSASSVDETVAALNSASSSPTPSVKLDSSTSDTKDTDPAFSINGSVPAAIAVTILAAAAALLGVGGLVTTIRKHHRRVGQQPNDAPAPVAAQRAVDLLLMGGGRPVRI